MQLNSLEYKSKFVLLVLVICLRGVAAPRISAWANLGEGMQQVQ